MEFGVLNVELLSWSLARCLGVGLNFIMEVGGSWVGVWFCVLGVGWEQGQVFGVCQCGRCGWILSCTRSVQGLGVWASGHCGEGGCPVLGLVLVRAGGAWLGFQGFRGWTCQAVTESSCTHSLTPNQTPPAPNKTPPDWHKWPCRGHSLWRLLNVLAWYYHGPPTSQSTIATQQRHHAPEGRA